MSIKQIPKIEEQNNISINVFGYENKQRFPLFVSKKVFETTLDLLLIMEDEKQHYVWIKDFNRFMYNQSKHNTENISADIVFNVLAARKFYTNTHQTA